ncbi:MAG: formyltransferase [Proteobacteria bacterium]|nr:formyltransferase [Pseudomonadota bacterium]
MTPPRAVVFAYHDVGARCLKALLSGGVDVPLVVTVPDDPAETRWYASVADTARDYGLPCIAPAGTGGAELPQRLRELQPDFVFSFYYRSLLPEELLRVARRGALNMHGSLLPRYRGRAPVNWAILRGERECGVTLHYMVARADAGDIVDQQSVPILQDDDAREVFAKVTVAAETVMARALPGLIAGTAARLPQPLLPGEYFGRRTAQDGLIDWNWPAQRIHDLVRAVAPPFPGAFAQVGGERWDIHRTRVGPFTVAPAAPSLRAVGQECQVVCRDGSVLRLLAGRGPGGPLDLPRLARRFAQQPLALV